MRYLKILFGPIKKVLLVRESSASTTITFGHVDPHATRARGYQVSFRVNVWGHPRGPLPAATPAGCSTISCFSAGAA
jgi:hypothetical protein